MGSGRPVKAGLDYFELDCHMEDKIRFIQAEFGLKGFAVVVKLYQKIYGEHGYYCEWNDDSLLLFASENGVSSREEKNLIQEIVSACIRRELFSDRIFKEYSVLTSAGVQKRYLRATSKRESVELIKEFLLIEVPEKSINVVINSISDGINSISDVRNSQIREDKIRQDKIRLSIRAYYPEDEKLNQAFADYVRMRKEIKHPMTDKAITLAMNKLEKLATHDGEFDHDMAIEILNQSVMNSWNGLFELKQKKTAFDDWRNA